jgi:hypothetical protein
VYLHNLYAHTTPHVSSSTDDENYWEIFLDVRTSYFIVHLYSSERVARVVQSAEEWLSGRRRSLGKRVGVKASRRFKSCLFRILEEQQSGTRCRFKSFARVLNVIRADVPLRKQNPYQNAATCDELLSFLVRIVGV